MPSQTNELHPAAKLLALVKRRDLTIAGKCESDLWRATWTPDSARRFAHAQIIAPMPLASEQIVEVLMAFHEKGLGGVMTENSTEFHFRLSFTSPADLREEEDEQGRPRLVGRLSQSFNNFFLGGAA